LTDKNNRPERIFIDPPENPTMIVRNDLKYAIIGGVIFPVSFFIVAQVLVWQGVVVDNMSVSDWIISSIINGILGAIFCVVIIPMIIKFMGWGN
jgi:membrane protein YdbS with pleckstrin-like domain